jgi:hypothetical protein
MLQKRVSPFLKSVAPQSSNLKLFLKGSLRKTFFVNERRRDLVGGWLDGCDVVKNAKKSFSVSVLQFSSSPFFAEKLRFLLNNICQIRRNKNAKGCL